MGLADGKLDNGIAAEDDIALSFSFVYLFPKRMFCFEPSRVASCLSDEVSSVENDAITQSATTINHLV